MPHYEPQQAPPHNLDAERAVLGSMLIDKETISVVCDLLQPSDFYSPAHQRVFEAMMRLHFEEQPIDLMTLYEDVRKHQQIEEIGGLAYLSSLEQYVMTTANVEHHAKIVHQKGRLRKLIDGVGEILSDCYGDEKDPDEVLEDTHRRLMDFESASAGLRGSYLTLGDYLDGVDKYPDLQSLWANRLIQSSTLNLLSAPTGIGKSIFVAQFALCVAAGWRFLNLQTVQGRILVIQTEVADSEQTDRIRDILRVCFEGVDSETRHQILQNVVVRDESADFHLWSAAPRWNGSTPTAMRYLDQLRRQIETLRPLIVILDPLSDIVPVANENDNAEIARALRPLRVIAEKSGVAFLLSHHWNKEAYGGKTVSEQRIRGGTKWLDTCSAGIELEPLKRDPDKYCQLLFKKHRYRGPLKPILLRRPTEGHLFFSLPSVDEKRLALASDSPHDAVLIDILESTGPMAWKDLVDRGKADTKRGRSWIAERIKILRARGLITDHGNFLKAADEKGNSDE